MATPACRLSLLATEWKRVQPFLRQLVPEPLLYMTLYTIESSDFSTLGTSSGSFPVSLELASAARDRTDKEPPNTHCTQPLWPLLQVVKRTGRGSHIVSSGLAWQNPLSKGQPAGTRCHAPQPGTRRGVLLTSVRARIVCLPHRKGSFGLNLVWSLTQDLFAIGDPNRGIKPRQLSSKDMGHANTSTMIRWQPRCSKNKRTLHCTWKQRRS